MEFYLAQQVDLEVEAIFKIYLLDYSGEKTIKHKNDYYSVIRTFEKGDFIELTCQKRIGDRKSTRLNSSHVKISYAVFCLKKKRKNKTGQQQDTATQACD